MALREAGLGRVLFMTIPTPMGSFSDWYIVAIVLYGGAFVAYAAALRHLTPPTAYPIIIGGAYVLIVAANWALTGEPLSWQSLVGGIIIMAGIILVVTAPSA